MSTAIGLIVGSGFERLPLRVVARSPMKTPYGPPSSPILTAILGDERVVCIARHGESHSIPPHEINYRANVWALYEHGVRRCVGVNTVGAIAPGFPPMDLAAPEQLIDYTFGRPASFDVEAGRVLHVDFTEPFDATLRAQIAAAIESAGYTAHAGVYGVTQGPRLETAAEIDRLARDGCTMVGMTGMPEAVLARELGISYAICAAAVNYAAGRAPHGTPIHGQLETYLSTAMERVGETLAQLIPAVVRGAM